MSSPRGSQDNQQKKMKGNIDKSITPNVNEKPRRRELPRASPVGSERDLPPLFESPSSHTPPELLEAKKPEEPEEEEEKEEAEEEPVEEEEAEEEPAEEEALKVPSITGDYAAIYREYEERINKLLLQYRAASENGLFLNPRVRVGAGIKPAHIFGYLLRAKNKLNEHDFIGVEHDLILAESNYHRAIFATSRIWRFNNTYAFPLWIYFMGMLSIILLFYWVTIDLSPLQIEEGRTGSLLGFPPLAVQAVIWGMIGGLFQDVWFLWRHVQNRDYRNTWVIQYLSAPFIGGILGAIVYIIIIAGLVILDSDASGTPRDFVVMAAAAFAGYNWDWAIKRFETIGTKLQD